MFEYIKMIFKGIYEGIIEARKYQAKRYSDRI